MGHRRSRITTFCGAVLAAASISLQSTAMGMDHPPLWVKLTAMCATCLASGFLAISPEVQRAAVRWAARTATKESK